MTAAMRMFPNTVPVEMLVGLLAVHWVGDFVLQTSWIAENKAKRLDVLSLHVAFYSVVLFIGALLLVPVAISVLIGFTAINAGLHCVTDLISARICQRLRDERHRHAFFVAIGADQLAHQIALLGSLSLILG